MLVRIFDIENGKVIPSEHCYTLNFLNSIIEAYPKEHMQVLQYLFYMSCPSPEMNPFFNVPEHEKEDIVVEEVGTREPIPASFTSGSKILISLAFIKRLFFFDETPIKGIPNLLAY